MDVDISKWSGDGDFTKQLIEVLQAQPDIASLRVEDAPASRSDPAFMFLSNELYVQFACEDRPHVRRWLGLVPITTRVPEAVLTLDGLNTRLATIEGIGEADYSDEGMLQFLRTQRIIPPYQTRGFKLVELVRIYAVS